MWVCGCGLVYVGGSCIYVGESCICGCGLVYVGVVLRAKLESNKVPNVIEYSFPFLDGRAACVHKTHSHTTPNLSPTHRT